ncbi:MAG: PDZ domain-containing protein [Nitrospirae bacterium]|nr:PDZ domain-containing protein [Nitrospirota bacterium]MBF0592171.1 PDZ domain-containing protein [Nitrospirota bacterium]
MKGFFRAVRYITIGLVLAIVFLFYLNPPQPVGEALGIKDKDRTRPKVSFTDAVLVAGKRFFNSRSSNNQQLNAQIPPDQLAPGANNPQAVDPLNNAQPYDNNNIQDPLAQQPPSNVDTQPDLTNNIPIRAQFFGANDAQQQPTQTPNLKLAPKTNNLANDLTNSLPDTATEKVIQEGHWVGLEVVPLTPQLAAANGIPDNVVGVLVDEVTLTAAASGVMAGDVITAINALKVKDLKTFEKSTRQVATINQATVTVYRGGKNGDIKVVANNALGVAQMEGAPMILSTATRPHGYYGPCDRCHEIARIAPYSGGAKTPSNNTGQLAKDAGDVLITTPPPIQWGAQPPHRDRGKCTNCHTIK